MSTHSAKSKVEARRMERARQAEREQLFGSNNQILITQVVGSVMPGDGDTPLVVAAFQVASEYIMNNATGHQEIDLTWEINGHKFNAGYWPNRDNDGNHADREPIAVPDNY